MSRLCRILLKKSISGEAFLEEEDESSGEESD
jgi:hypothetical protein